MQDKFAWILQTYFKLEKRIERRTENTHASYQFVLFEQQIFTFAHLLTRIDVHKTVGLIDCLFKDQVNQHLSFTRRMNEYPKEQYEYTNKLLEIHNEQAKLTMTECSMVHKEHLAVTQAEDWLVLLNINLELAC